MLAPGQAGRDGLTELVGLVAKLLSSCFATDPLPREGLSLCAASLADLLQAVEARGGALRVPAVWNGLQQCIISIPHQVKLLLSPFADSCWLAGCACCAIGEASKQAIADTCDSLTQPQLV